MSDEDFRGGDCLPHFTFGTELYGKGFWIFTAVGVSSGYFARLDSGMPHEGKN